MRKSERKPPVTLIIRRELTGYGLYWNAPGAFRE
jgi:hypothetical protein